jgi:cytokinin dehydrogenase
MTLSRRELLKLSTSSLGYIVGAQIFFGNNVSAEIIKKFYSSQAHKSLLDLPIFEGVYSFDPSTLEQFASDFGRNVHKTPMGVLKPANENDIKKLLKYCFAQNIKVTMRGMGGSAYGQSQIEQGIVIDSSSLKSISWLSNDLLELEPGLLWREVVDFTNSKNRCVAVLPDTIVTSVGGTANVGGIGETSYNWGALVDQVVEFDLILPNGDLLTCNENQNKDLFALAFGSMGQFGVMTRLVLKTIEMPAVTFLIKFSYDGLDTKIFDDLKIIALNEPNGGIGGHFVRSADGKTFRFELEVTNWSKENPDWLSKISAASSPIFNRSYYEYAHRNTKGWDSAVAGGALKLPRPYVSFYVPFDESANMAKFLQQEALANLGAAKLMFMPLIKSKFSRELFKLPDSDLIGHFRIYRVVRTGENSVDHQAMLAANINLLLPKIFELGGKVYLPFSPLLTEDQLREHFGANRYTELKKLKNQMDPKLILNSSAGIFS